MSKILTTHTINHSPNQNLPSFSWKHLSAVLWPLALVKTTLSIFSISLLVNLNSKKKPFEKFTNGYLFPMLEDLNSCSRSSWWLSRIFFWVMMWGTLAHHLPLDPDLFMETLAGLGGCSALWALQQRCFYTITLHTKCSRASTHMLMNPSSLQM